MIYDTKWLKESNKPMETVEDAICYVVGRLRCGNCPSCPVHLYHDGCSEHYEVKAKAIKLLAGVDIDFSTDEKMYKSINAIEGKCRIGHDQTRTCATCNESFDHSPGVRFCRSWHNFTHDTGFCYRYDPVIMEDKAAVDK